MRWNRAAARRLAAGVALGCALPLTATGHGDSDQERQQPDPYVRVSALTGATRSIELDRPVAGVPPATDSADGFVEPRAFLERYGRTFGLAVPATELAVERTWSDPLGTTHTRYQQRFRGVRVFPGALTVHQNRAGIVSAADGHVFRVPADLAIEPALDRDEAGRTVLLHAAGADPHVEHTELVVTDPGWYGDPARGVRLAWLVATRYDAPDGGEHFLVDAVSGEVLDRWGRVYHDRQRRVHDGAGLTQLPGRLARSEGDPPVEPAEDPVPHDINAAYDYIGQVYDFYANAYGRDGIADEGRPVRVTVNSTAIGGGQCPTAFFSSDLRQAVFCLGRVPDDVVAHELTHGVTFFSAGVLYQNQGAALHEHFSFVFGETIDLFNSGSEAAGETRGAPSGWAVPSGHGLDEPNRRRSRCSYAPDYEDGVRWLYNEDRFEFEGAGYDYWDPTCFGHADRAGSPLYTCPTWNSGGAHLGATVPNHGYALAVDGGSFNGYQISGIGLVKAAAVWYRALTVYLTSAADFEDLYWALGRAAQDLVGSELADPASGRPSGQVFSAADAADLDLALRAVELDGPGRCGATVDVLEPGAAVECGGREGFGSWSFADGMPPGWTVASEGPAPRPDWRVTDPGEVVPGGRQGRVAHCPTPQTSCVYDNAAGVSHLISPVMTMPATALLPTLAFDHFVATEDLVDGGVVALQVGGDDADWQVIPATAFYHNGYNRELLPATAGNTNPLAGSAAFSGGGAAWGTSLVALAALVSPSDTFRVRFTMSTDRCTGGTGWYVAAVRVYDCPASGDCDGDLTPDDVQLAIGADLDVAVRHASTHAESALTDADPVGIGPAALAERVPLLLPVTLRALRIWGVYAPWDLPGRPRFTVVVHADDPVTALPGAEIARLDQFAVARRSTGLRTLNGDEWEITLTLPDPLRLAAGVYWFEVFDDTRDDATLFRWIQGGYDPGIVHSASASEAPGRQWRPVGQYHYAIELLATPRGPDCNANGVLDACDIASGIAGDTDGDRVPDQCDGAPPRPTTGRVGG